MSSSIDNLFKEFFEYCNAVLVSESPKILDLIQHRYDECDKDFRFSQKMADLLTDTKRKMEEEKSRLFVHLKDFTDILKENRKSKKKRKRQNDDLEVTTKPFSIVTERIDIRPMSDDLCQGSETKKRKLLSCHVGDGLIDNAQIIKDCSDQVGVTVNLEPVKLSDIHCLDAKESLCFNPKRIHISRPVPVVTVNSSDDIIEIEVPDSRHKSNRSPSKDRQVVGRSVIQNTDVKKNKCHLSFGSDLEESSSSCLFGNIKSGEASLHENDLSCTIRNGKNEISSVDSDDKDKGDEDNECNEVVESPGFDCLSNTEKQSFDLDKKASEKSSKPHNTSSLNLIHNMEMDSPSPKDDVETSVDKQVNIGVLSSTEPQCSSLNMSGGANTLLDSHGSFSVSKSLDMEQSSNSCIDTVSHNLSEPEKTQQSKDCQASDEIPEIKSPNELSDSGSPVSAEDSPSTTKEDKPVSSGYNEAQICFQSVQVVVHQYKGPSVINTSDNSDGKDCCVNLEAGELSPPSKETHSPENDSNSNDTQCERTVNDTDTIDLSNVQSDDDEVEKDLLSFDSKDSKPDAPGDLISSVENDKEPVLKSSEVTGLHISDVHSETDMDCSSKQNGIDDAVGGDSQYKEYQGAWKRKGLECDEVDKTGIPVLVEDTESTSGEKNSKPNTSSEGKLPQRAQLVPVVENSKSFFLGSLSLASKTDCEEKNLGKQENKAAKKSLSSKLKGDTEPNSADEFEVDQTSKFNTVDKTKDKKAPSERHIKKLEQLLEKLRNEIEKGRELSLDDLDKEDSFYIYEDKLKKKFVAAWNKLCEITSRTVTTGRPTERTIHYSGTRYREINRRLEKFLNKKKAFPDFQDVKTIIKLTNRKCNLHLSAQMINDVSREAFVDIGEMLQTRRHQDFIATFGSREIDNYSSHCDPAFNDPQLRRKLEQNRKTATSNLDAVINKYTQLQYAGKAGDDDDDSEKSSDDSDVGHNRKKKRREKEKERKNRKIYTSSEEEEEEEGKEEEEQEEQMDIAAESGSEKDTEVRNEVGESKTTENAEIGKGTGPKIKYTKRKLIPSQLVDDTAGDSVSQSYYKPSGRFDRSLTVSNPESEDETSESDEDKDDDDDEKGGSNDKKNDDDEDDDLDVLVVSSDNSDDESSASSKCPSPACVISLSSDLDDDDDDDSSNQPNDDALDQKPVIEKMDSEVKQNSSQLSVEDASVSSVNIESSSSQTKQDEEDSGNRDGGKHEGSPDVPSTPKKLATDSSLEVIVISDTPTKPGNDGEGEIKGDENESSVAKSLMEIEGSELRGEESLKGKDVHPSTSLTENKISKVDVREDDSDDAICIIMDVRTEGQTDLIQNMKTDTGKDRRTVDKENKEDKVKESTGGESFHGSHSKTTSTKRDDVNSGCENVESDTEKKGPNEEDDVIVLSGSDTVSKSDNVDMGSANESDGVTSSNKSKTEQEIAQDGTSIADIDNSKSISGCEEIIVHDLLPEMESAQTLMDGKDKDKLSKSEGRHSAVVDCETGVSIIENDGKEKQEEDDCENNLKQQPQKDKERVINKDGVERSEVEFCGVTEVRGKDSNIQNVEERLGEKITKDDEDGEDVHSGDDKVNEQVVMKDVGDERENGGDEGMDGVVGNEELKSGEDGVCEDMELSGQKAATGNENVESVEGDDEDVEHGSGTDMDKRDDRVDGEKNNDSVKKGEEMEKEDKLIESNEAEEGGGNEELEDNEPSMSEKEEKERGGSEKILDKVEDSETIEIDKSCEKKAKSTGKVKDVHKEDECSEDWKVNEDFEVYMDRGDEEEEEEGCVLDSATTTDLCDPVVDDSNDSDGSGKKKKKELDVKDDEQKLLKKKEEGMEESAEDDEEQPVKVLKCRRSKEDDRKLVDELMKGALERMKSSSSQRKADKVSDDQNDEDEENDNDLEITNVEIADPAKKKVKLVHPVSDPIPSANSLNSDVKNLSPSAGQSSRIDGPKGMSSSFKGNRGHSHSGTQRSSVKNPSGINWDLIRASLPPIPPTGKHSHPGVPAPNRNPLSKKPLASQMYSSVPRNKSPSQSNVLQGGRGVTFLPASSKRTHHHSYINHQGTRLNTLRGDFKAVSRFNPQPRRGRPPQGQNIPSLRPRVPIPRIPSQSFVKLPFNNKMPPQTPSQAFRHSPYSLSERQNQNRPRFRPPVAHRPSHPPPPPSHHKPVEGGHSAFTARVQMQERQASYVAAQQKKIDGLVMVLDDSDDDETNDSDKVIKSTTAKVETSSLIKTSPSAGKKKEPVESSPERSQGPNQKDSVAKATAKKGGSVIVLSDSE